MDRRRAFWLVAWPVVAVLAAHVVGLGALTTASLGMDLDGASDATGLQLVVDRAATTGAMDLADLTGSFAALAAVVLGVMCWVVMLGVGAQRYFPPRRRLVPAALVLLAAAIPGAVWLTVDFGVEGRTVGSLVRVVAVSALVAGVTVFPLTGLRWRADAPHHHHEPPVYGHLADIF